MINVRVGFSVGVVHCVPVEQPPSHGPQSRIYVASDKMDGALFPVHAFRMRSLDNKQIRGSATQDTVGSHTLTKYCSYLQ